MDLGLDLDFFGFGASADASATGDDSTRATGALWTPRACARSRCSRRPDNTLPIGEHFIDATKIAISTDTDTDADTDADTDIFTYF